MKINFFMLKCPFRKRYKIFSLAWGKGYTPLAGSNYYFNKKITFAMTSFLFKFKQSFQEWRISCLFLEIHYREN